MRHLPPGLRRRLSPSTFQQLLQSSLHSPLNLPLGQDEFTPWNTHSTHYSCRLPSAEHLQMPAPCWMLRYHGHPHGNPEGLGLCPPETDMQAGLVPLCLEGPSSPLCQIPLRLQDSTQAARSYGQCPGGLGPGQHRLHDTPYGDIRHKAQSRALSRCSMSVNSFASPALLEISALMTVPDSRDTEHLHHHRKL